MLEGLQSPARLTESLFRSDLDIMCHWFSPDTPVRISSFGGLQHFRKSSKPAMAGDATRCLDCAHETQCPYSAKKSEFFPNVPRSVVSEEGEHFNFRQFIWTGSVGVTSAGQFSRSSTESQTSRTSRKRSCLGLTGSAYTRAITMSAITRYVYTTRHTRRDHIFTSRWTDDACPHQKKGRQHPVCIRRNRLFHDGRLHHLDL